MNTNVQNQKYEYYHWSNSNRGDRYFRVDREEKEVWQVCINGGEMKKGRVHCQGIYKMAYSSFLGSYYWHFEREGKYTKMILSTEEEYKKAISIILNKIFITKNKTTCQQDTPQE